MVAKAVDDDFGHAPPPSGRRKAGCIRSFLYSAGAGGISNCNCFNIPDNASNSSSEQSPGMLLTKSPDDGTMVTRAAIESFTFY